MKYMIYTSGTVPDIKLIFSIEFKLEKVRFKKINN